jgi:hypothetical protein
LGRCNGGGGDDDDDDDDKARLGQFFEKWEN